MKKIALVTLIFTMLLMAANTAFAKNQIRYEIYHLSFFSNTQSNGSLNNMPGLRNNIAVINTNTRLGWEYNFGYGVAHRYQGLYVIYNIPGLDKSGHNELWWMYGLGDVYLTQDGLRGSGLSYGLRYRTCKTKFCGDAEYMVFDVKSSQLGSNTVGVGFEYYIF